MNDPVYANYWKRKTLLSSCPAFPVVKDWTTTEGLSETEAAYFQEIKTAKSLLDYGAGDLRIKKKMIAAGFTGVYHTLDVGQEFAHDYSDLTEVQQTYDAILCLEVLEHMHLKDGVQLMIRLTELLNPGGVLIIHTPNSRCIVHTDYWDMTHLHSYNLPDLWAFFRAMGMEVSGYRTWCVDPPPWTLRQRLRKLIHCYVVSRIIGLDYAHGIAVIARKPVDMRERVSDS